MNVWGVTFGGCLAKILSFKLGNLLYKSNFYLLSEGTVHCLFFKEMTLNKMVWNFWHQFLIRFSMLFQMVPFILLCMVAHLTITWLVETIPTANQRALCWWFLKLPWREKRKVPSERAMKIESETGVKSDTPFCLRLPIEKTNSASYCISLIL